MTHRVSAHTATRWNPLILFAGLLVMAAVVLASVGASVLSSASPSASASRPDVLAAVGSIDPPLLAPPTSAPASRPGAATTGMLRGGQRGDVREADGVLPDRVTVFDDTYPGIANLEADLLRALRRAATDAADDGVRLLVESGWRSPVYQDRLLREAVSKYGSRKEAARWVATPTTSAHVAGEAVDLGPSGATTWLSEHGSRYGLCQIYDNEPWHYELRQGAIDHGCPRMYADPSHDPRMQR